VYVPAADNIFDKISKSVLSWNSSFILQFICEEFVEKEISLVGGSSLLLPPILSDRSNEQFSPKDFSNLGR
jgi:hypothetical protein